jgi:hypothetical protein
MLFLLSALCSALLALYGATALPRALPFYIVFYSLDALHFALYIFLKLRERRRRALTIAPASHHTQFMKKKEPLAAHLACFAPVELIAVCTGHPPYHQVVALLRLNRLLHLAGVWTNLRRRAKSVTEGGFQVRTRIVRRRRRPHTHSPPPPPRTQFKISLKSPTPSFYQSEVSHSFVFIHQQGLALEGVAVLATLGHLAACLWQALGKGQGGDPRGRWPELTTNQSRFVLH